LRIFSPRKLRKHFQFLLKNLEILKWETYKSLNNEQVPEDSFSKQVFIPKGKACKYLPPVAYKDTDLWHLKVSLHKTQILYCLTLYIWQKMAKNDTKLSYNTNWKASSYFCQIRSYSTKFGCMTQNLCFK
jgi:hypothetical protein